MKTLALLVASLLSVEAAFAAPILVGLGVSGSPSAVSDDGSTVVGSAAGAGFLWTASGGAAPLGGAGVQPRDLSADGSVVVGRRSLGGGQFEAFRWTSAGGVVSFVGQEATGISSDGSVIVGTLDDEAYRWTEATGAVGLGFLFAFGSPEDPNFVGASYADGVSTDGTVVVGETGELGKDHAIFRWTESGGMVQVLIGGPSLVAAEVSGDGSVVFAHSDTFQDTYVWAASGAQLFGPGGFQTRVGGLDGDGSLAVGSRQFFDGVSQDFAFLWDPVNGTRVLADVLRDDYGLDLGGWILTGATDISADGRTLVGYGVNPSGQSEAWLVSLPEPGAALLLAAAAAWLGWSRRRC